MGELTSFLRQKEDWYDPDELLKDANLLSSVQMDSSQISDGDAHTIGMYMGREYVIDERDGFAKPAEEVV